MSHKIEKLFTVLNHDTHFISRALLHTLAGTLSGFWSPLALTTLRKSQTSEGLLVHFLVHPPRMTFSVLLVSKVSEYQSNYTQHNDGYNALYVHMLFQFLKAGIVTSSNTILRNKNVFLRLVRPTHVLRFFFSSLQK